MCSLLPPCSFPRLYAYCASCLPFECNAWLELDWICPALDPSRREARPLLALWVGTWYLVPSLALLATSPRPKAPRALHRVRARKSGGASLAVNLGGGCRLHPSLHLVQLLYHFHPASIVHPTLSVHTHPICNTASRSGRSVLQLDGDAVAGVRPRTTPHINGQ